MDFLGGRIRRLRERKGLKQKDLAAEFSISENTWSQYENNKRTPDIGTIKRIAQFFGVSIDYLMNLIDEVYNPTEDEFKDLMRIYCSLSKEEKSRMVEELKNRYLGGEEKNQDVS